MNPTLIEIKKTQMELLHRVICEEFSHKMAKQLDVHAHVGNFLEWSPTPNELLAEISHRIAVLGARDSRDQISSDCADIANMLLRFSQLYGS